jgi:(p)ppGpp synthase/HD superfamily hydrolase
MSSENIIDRAVRLAAKAHQGQLRKFTDIPYFTHPVGVALILAQYGFSEELIAAGLLHDTVEDSDLSIEDIKSRFGLKIAGIVEGCSEPDKTQEWYYRSLEKSFLHPPSSLEDIPIFEEFKRKVGDLFEGPPPPDTEMEKT